MSGGFAKARPPVADPRIEKALVILRQQIDRPLRMDRLARECCLSKPQFYRLFRQTTGLTPARMLKLLRLQEALRLLTATTLPVKDIAVRAGFGDLSHFIRDFSAAHGVTPLGYRASARRTSMRVTLL